MEFFSQTNPRQQLRWSASSLEALKRCPRYYQYRYIEGWKKKDRGVHLMFGAAFADSMEVFHREVLVSDFETARNAAILSALRTKTEDGKEYWNTDDSLKCRESLVRAIVWYFEQFKDDLIKTTVLADGTPAAELEFYLPLGIYTQNTGEEYNLYGFLDRVGTYGLDVYVADNKTTKMALSTAYFKQFHPNVQVSLYSVIGKLGFGLPVKGVIIDAMQLLAGGVRFARVPIHISEEELNEFLLDTETFLRVNEEYVRRDYWPKNETACDKYGGCAFREVCTAHPAMKQRILQSDFQPRTERNTDDETN